MCVCVCVCVCVYGLERVGIKSHRYFSNAFVSSPSAGSRCLGEGRIVCMIFLFVLLLI